MHGLAQKELCVCDLAVLPWMTKLAVSHQLNALRLSNLVKFRREGQVVYCSLANHHVYTILNISLEYLHK